MITPASDLVERTRHLERPGGVRLVYRTLGAGTPVLLLHATLSTGAQLEPLARALAAGGDLALLSVDRRGSGQSRVAIRRPLAVGTHVADLAAVLDEEGHEAAVLVGHSFGGVVALEFAARQPRRTLAAVVYEPPYGPVADEATRDGFAAVAAATERAGRRGGAAAAAEAFLRGVAGDAAWDTLSERRRSSVAGEGDGARADASLRGLDPEGLRRIAVRTTLITGGGSEPFYVAIADALAGRIPTSRRVHLPDLRHSAPITDPAPIAAAVLAELVTFGIVASTLRAPAQETSP